MRKSGVVLFLLLTFIAVTAFDCPPGAQPAPNKPITSPGSSASTQQGDNVRAYGIFEGAKTSFPKVVGDPEDAFYMRLRIKSTVNATGLTLATDPTKGMASTDPTKASEFSSYFTQSVRTTARSIRVVADVKYVEDNGSETTLPAHVPINIGLDTTGPTPQIVSRSDSEYETPWLPFRPNTGFDVVFHNDLADVHDVQIAEKVTSAAAGAASVISGVWALNKLAMPAAKTAGFRIDRSWSSYLSGTINSSDRQVFGRRGELTREGVYKMTLPSGIVITTLTVTVDLKSSALKDAYSIAEITAAQGTAQSGPRPDILIPKYNYALSPPAVLTSFRMSGPPASDILTRMRGRQTYIDMQSKNIDPIDFAQKCSEYLRYLSSDEEMTPSDKAIVMYEFLKTNVRYVTDAAYRNSGCLSEYDGLLAAMNVPPIQQQKKLNVPISILEGVMTEVLSKKQINDRSRAWFAGAMEFRDPANVSNANPPTPYTLIDNGTKLDAALQGLAFERFGCWGTVDRSNLPSRRNVIVKNDGPNAQFFTVDFYGPNDGVDEVIRIIDINPIARDAISQDCLAKIGAPRPRGT